MRMWSLRRWISRGQLLECVAAVARFPLEAPRETRFPVPRSCAPALVDKFEIPSVGMVRTHRRFARILWRWVGLAYTYTGPFRIRSASRLIRARLRCTWNGLFCAAIAALVVEEWTGGWSRWYLLCERRFGSCASLTGEELAAVGCSAFSHGKGCSRVAAFDRESRATSVHRNRSS